MSFPRYERYKNSGAEWPGEVPEHWDVCAIKRIANLRSGETINSEQIEDSGEFPVFGGNGLRGFTSRFTHDGTYALIGRQGALCGNVNYARGRFWASEHAVVVSTLGKTATFWIGELLRAMNLNQYSVSAAQPGLAVESIRNLRIPVPPYQEQVAIADFIEQEYSKIDALVAEQQRLIELLKEKRQAVISHAVTKGLTPNTSMKPSGIEWIGKVPEHWSILRTRMLFNERDQRSTTGKEEMLTVSHLTGVTRRSEKNVNMFEAETNEGYKLCRAGDLVINTLWGWMGAMGTAPEDGMVSPAYNVYEPNGKSLPSFIDALVRTRAFIDEVARYSKGVWSSRLRIYPTEFFQIYMPVPPIEEQRAIADAINQVHSQTEQLCSEAEQAINLLQERRSALISAAVTGKIDVRNTVPEPVA